MLRIAKFDRYDLLNTPGTDKPAFTIWFSGCKMNCDGCHNKRLQDPSSGDNYHANTVLMVICRECEKTGVDTVVLLGGEPLEQPEYDLYVLLSMLHKNDFNVWLYTGKEFNEVPPMYKDFLTVIKSGSYNKDLDTGGFPASSNQKLYRKINNEWIEDHKGEREV